MRGMNLLSGAMEVIAARIIFLRNLHTAERLVRGFLFEFRTCLDHMETEIKRAYGEDSDLWEIFKTGTVQCV